MPTPISPIITNAGLAAAQAQSGLGLQLAITHVQLGSGGFALNTTEGSADYNRTGLVTPREKVVIAAGHVIAKGFRVDALFPPWLAAAYNANEIGFWAGDPASGGTLFAYWAQTATIVNRNPLDYLASFSCALARVPNGSVTVTFDINASVAAQLVAFHEQAADPHQQYQSKVLGHVYSTLAGIPLTVNTTLSTDLAGRWLEPQANGLTITLPLLSAAAIGLCTYTFRNPFFDVTIKGSGTDLIANDIGTSGNTFVLRAGQTVSITANGGSWAVVAIGGGKTPPQFDNDERPATTKFVQRAQGNAQGISIYAANTTIPASVVGSVVAPNVNNLTLTLPLTSACPAGSTLTFYGNACTGTVIARQGAEVIQMGSDGAVASVALKPLDRLTLVNLGGSWYAMGGEAAQAVSSSFAANRVGAGFQKLPGGLILQWGNGGYAASTPVSFPLAFPTQCLNVNMGAGNFNSGAASGSKVIAMTAANITATGFEASSATGVSAQGAWIAIGF